MLAPAMMMCFSISKLVDFSYSFDGRPKVWGSDSSDRRPDSGWLGDQQGHGISKEDRPKEDLFCHTRQVGVVWITKMRLFYCVGFISSLHCSPFPYDAILFYAFCL